MRQISSPFSAKDLAGKGYSGHSGVSAPQEECPLQDKFLAMSVTIIAVADPGFAKGRGANHSERAEREPKRGSGGGAHSGVQGQSHWWGVRGLPLKQKLKAFCPLSYKKWPKFKDLNENLPPCLKQTASCSHDQC